MKCSNNLSSSFLTLALLLLAFISIAQQPKDLGRMTIYQNHFYNQILEGLHSQPKDGKIVFQAIPSNTEIPQSIDEFETVWRMMPVSQGRTGTCWDFATTSFIETEIYRITGRQIKLSEMYFAYHEYLNKAEEYISTQGKSRFSEGSEANAVTRIMKKHGILPFSVYESNPLNKAFPDHKTMVDDLRSLLESYKNRGHWDRELILGGVKLILNKHMGEPPLKFEYQGVKHDPMSFMKEIALINPNDYLDFMSLKSETYWSKSEYKVLDNYWHSNDYLNVPLEYFMDIIKKALKAGYSISIGGDVSESGYLPQYDVAFIPSYDIPSAYIDENARQFRFSNKSTTDDHFIHLIGYKEAEENGSWWFLVKDSSSSSYNGKNKGYFFYHEDYIKLKMMNITLHKEAVEKEILGKF